MELPVEELNPRPDDLMTTGEAARVLDLSADMVRYLERTGRLPAQRTTNGVRLFRRGDVEQLAARRAQQADKARDASRDQSTGPPRGGRGT